MVNYVECQRIQSEVSSPGFHQRSPLCCSYQSMTVQRGYLASSTKLLALLGVGDAVLGVNVAIIAFFSCRSEFKTDPLVLALIFLLFYWLSVGYVKEEEEEDDEGKVVCSTRELLILPGFQQILHCCLTQQMTNYATRIMRPRILPGVTPVS